MDQDVLYVTRGDLHVATKFPGVAQSRVYHCRVVPHHPGVPDKWRLQPVNHEDPRVDWVDFNLSRALYRAKVDGKEKRSYRRVELDHSSKTVVVIVNRRKRIVIGGPLYSKYEDFLARNLLK